MYRKLSVGLLATTFFAVLVSTGVAIASQSVPEDRLSLVLGENCRAQGQTCRNDNQCCNGICEKRSFLPWLPGKCTATTRPSQPTENNRKVQKPQSDQPRQQQTDSFNQQQCQHMNQYTKQLETQLQKAEREMERLREQVQSVQKQANQMCQIQEESTSAD